ncbi:hypothetical protein MYX84_09960 [Acidobacteria bacterium AH-259-O06]|nr:hypothetical protein [Acidobacteria bacterium AH-259-O06]
MYRNIPHPMYAAHWLWAIAQVLLLQELDRRLGLSGGFPFASFAG